MTDTNNTDGAALLPVTPEDRELAIALFEAGLLKSPLGASAPDDMVVARWRKGILGEGDHALQVIARHRQSSSNAGGVDPTGIERSKVVMLERYLRRARRILGSTPSKIADDIDAYFSGNALTPPTPDRIGKDAVREIDDGLVARFRSALRFAASHSVISSADEQHLLAALTDTKGDRPMGDR